MYLYQTLFEQHSDGLLEALLAASEHLGNQFLLILFHIIDC